jgi:hypothetical protein
VALERSKLDSDTSAARNDSALITTATKMWSGLGFIADIMAAL